MYVLRVKGKYFKTKYTPLGILVIVNDMINSKIKIQSKSINRYNSATIYVSIQIYSKNILALN
jgi:hypothetical protein